MRMLLRAEISAENGNHGLQTGKWQKVTSDFLEQFKPESMYFVLENGKRNVYAIVHIDKVTQVPAIAEPWIQGLKANVEVMPALNFDEMDEAGPSIAMAIGNYASKLVREID